MRVSGDEHDGLTVQLKSRFADVKTAWIKIASIKAISSKEPRINENLDVRSFND
jgi:hypothetical protein